jgi:uncharacterized protein
MSFLPVALPWRGLLVLPLLLLFVSTLLFSTATLAFYLKQRLSLHRLRGVLERGPAIEGSAIAALLGAATPFCTCTAVPLFIGMLEVDVPLGPAVSFLLASPTINLGAVILLLVVFGWHTGLFYGAACLLASILVGWSLGRTPREAALRDYLWIEGDAAFVDGAAPAIQRAALLARQLTRKLLPWLALATAAGILLDAVLPTSTVSHFSQWGIVGIPAAALLGSVIYADILLLIPVGYVLIQHGASVPVVLTFMLAASGLSLAEVVVLTRVLRPRVVVLFVGATLAMYTALGYGFAWI